MATTGRLRQTAAGRSQWPIAAPKWTQGCQQQQNLIQLLNRSVVALRGYDLDVGTMHWSTAIRRVKFTVIKPDVANRTDAIWPICGTDE
jgi:hypothetical protein